MKSGKLNKKQNNDLENKEMQINCVYFKSSTKMSEIYDESIDLIVTSPPYFNIKDYSKDGYQKRDIQN